MSRSRWVIHSRAEFEARHALTLYEGKPEEPHSHQWQVAITIGVDQLNAEGYALDFHAVHKTLNQAVSPLHGSDLNSHSDIGYPSPTAERVAEVLAAQLQPAIEAIGGVLLTLSVWEGPGNRVDLNLVF